MTPNFDIHGNLTPYEVIKMNLADLEEGFVNSFPDSITRARLFQNFSEYLFGLRQLVDESIIVWVDGSYITNKKNPRDVDFVTFIDYKKFEANEIEVDRLRLFRNNTELGLDGYFVVIYPAHHQKNVLYEADKIQWLYQFGRSRSDRSKGIIEINF